MIDEDIEMRTVCWHVTCPPMTARLGLQFTVLLGILQRGVFIRKLPWGKYTNFTFAWLSDSQGE